MEFNTYLLVKLGEGWLEELVDLSLHVVRVLRVRQTLAGVGLLGKEVLLDRARKAGQRDALVLRVAKLLEFDVRNLLEGDDRRVVGRYVTGQFGEV